MIFTLKELSFDLDALEPALSKETIEYHYGKHHLGYVNKLNDLIEGTEFEEKTLEELINDSSGPIFNNAAQIWNHDFYWKGLRPQEKRGDNKPNAFLLSEIEKIFKSYNDFEQEFKTNALSHFGSGWTWLVKTPEGSMEILNTSNAGNPLSEGKHPLLVCDLWEHAYYIDYRNDRKTYLDNYWNLINWDAVEESLLQRKS